MAPFVTRAAKGAWKMPTLPPLYLRHVHLWDVPHRAPQGAARSAPESPGEASASSTMPTSSSHRSEEPRLAHFVSSLGKEVRKSTC